MKRSAHEIQREIQELGHRSDIDHNEMIMLYCNLKLEQIEADESERPMLYDYTEMRKQISEMQERIIALGLRVSTV